MDSRTSLFTIIGRYVTSSLLRIVPIRVIKTVSKGEESDYHYFHELRKKNTRKFTNRSTSYTPILIGKISL
jgi:hypothetical protein